MFLIKLKLVRGSGTVTQDPSEINGDNLNNIRRKTSRHFRNKEGIFERQN
jgi:hypothetical protein